MELNKSGLGRWGCAKRLWDEGGRDWELWLHERSCACVAGV